MKKNKPALFIIALVGIITCLSGCVAPMTPQQQQEKADSFSYWLQYVPNKHAAIKNLGQPDDISLHYWNNDGYKRLILTWFDVKTPDGKHWDKLSFWFYNYAPDFKIYEGMDVHIVEPRLPGYSF